MFSTLKLAPVAVAAGILLSNTLSAEISGSLMTGYESRHIYRGVDSAMEGSIQWTLAQVNMDNLYLGGWYGTGPSTTYEEFDIYGGYTFEVGEWRIVPNFIWYHFPKDDSIDSTDVMLRLERDWFVDDTIVVTPQFIYSYNLDAEGHYFEAGANIAIVLDENWLFSVRPALAVSRDLRPENGFDHAEVISRLTYKVTDVFAVEGFIGYTYALDAVEPIDGDKLWGGITLSASF